MQCGSVRCARTHMRAGVYVCVCVCTVGCRVHVCVHLCA